MSDQSWPPKNPENEGTETPETPVEPTPAEPVATDSAPEPPAAPPAAPAYAMPPDPAASQPTAAESLPPSAPRHAEPEPEPFGAAGAPPSAEPYASAGAPYGQQPPSEPFGQQPPSDPHGGYGQQPPPSDPYGQPAGGYGQQPPPADPRGAPPGGYGPPGAYPPAGPPPYAGPPAGGYPPPPAPGTVDIGGALSYAWRKFSGNPLPFILLVLISGGVSAVIAMIGFAMLAAILYSARNLDDPTGAIVGASLGGVILGLVIVFVALLVSMGIFRAAIDTVRGRPVSVGSSFRMTDFGKYLGLYGLLVLALLVVNIVFSFIPGVGTFLAYLVAIAAGVLFFFAPFLVLDRSMGAMDALKASYALAMRNLGQTILVVLVLGVISAVGGFVLGVGAFVTVPLAMIAAASIYLSLHGEPSAP